ncbi:LytR cell envelope-related transcriptional attenuator [Modestobacter sp. DSM 44400]|uniref:LytR C-terminal domain-containing protein n=1 Tax=Modestobacter sp. DSM 44400 TaxID=1550230 RepID=UPI000894F4BA|nr:LytR C-terminal domain-containing protein [Modestobacter sp. DSM 44400]SDX71508.1 LytR cell envelope-related transcriptional attenuator [Modestobacter sp. DSM 44400]
MTMPRRSRAERRREGLLPAGEDPLLRRPPTAGRPGPAVPPVTGRRRTDQPGPAPSPADVPTSATLSTSDGAARIGADRSRLAAPATPSPATRAPQTTNLPFTPGLPASAPDADPFPFDDQPDRRSAAAAAAAPAGRRAAEPAPPAAPAAWTPAEPAARPARTPAAPRAAAPDLRSPAVERETTALPPLAWGEEPAEAPVHEGAPARVPGPGSGPVGGRAAARLERQAAEAAARKGGRRGSTAAGPLARPGGPPAPPSGSEREAATDGQRGRGAPRRAVQLVLATVVVALAVLGVWSFTSPRTEETSARTPAATGAPPSSAAAPAVEATPSAEATPSVPAGPVRAPITVLNSTRITGLAADIGDQFSVGGWQVNEPGAYGAADVAITTVYYTAGNSVQQDAANQLREQFPDLAGGPAERFFDVPGVPDPGLVVVVTGDWRP